MCIRDRKYSEAGCENISPQTEACGYIAPFSVSEMPICFMSNSSSSRKLTGTGVYSRISQEVYARNKAAQEEVTLIQNRMNVIELMPEEELLALQKEKELSTEKRAAGIKLLAEQNEQLNVVRSLKIQEELCKKKQQEEQEEQAREKVLQGALASQEEGLVHFKAQWEAIQPDLKKARQLDVQIQSQQSSYIPVSYTHLDVYKRQFHDRKIR